MSKSNSNIGTTKYRDLISQDSKKVAEETLDFTAQEAKHTVNVAVLETKKAIFQAKRQLADAQKAQPYILKTEVDLIIKIENLEQGLAIAEEIQSNRF